MVFIKEENSEKQERYDWINIEKATRIIYFTFIICAKD